MMNYPVTEIVRILKGELAGGRLTEATVRDILIDSRKLIQADQCLFFALVSKRNDGHKYIPELYRKGVRNFVVSIPPLILEAYPGANFIVVRNTLSGLQTLARFHRDQFSIPVIGITGSNGKTIVKEWLFQLMSRDKSIIRSPKSYNSQIGVPLSVWQIEPGHELAIFEAGISEPDEMDRIAPIIRPTIGIFTNIGEAHSENFISIQQKVGEKLKLFKRVDALIYCLDQSEVLETILRSEIQKSIGVFTWSRKQQADLTITKTSRQKNGNVAISAIFKGQEIGISIPFTDDASVENAIQCWATMLYLGYDPEQLPERFMALTPIAMRLELKDGINHCTIINDSYNSDINSLGIAIDFLNSQANTKNRTVILSDILQSGKDEEELYSKIAEIIHGKSINRLIGIGPAIGRQADRFHLAKSFFPSTEEFLRHFSFNSFSDEFILLKGARVFEFEQISQALQQKTHETVLEINLNALVHNLNYYRSKINPDTKLMAMVKAFSYGTGSFEIANSLQFHRIDYLAVAYADEGVELRKAGITVPIMVMNPEEQSFDSIIQHSLEPEIYSLRVLEMLENTIRKNILPMNKPVKIHIKLDTGMHRLGFMENDLDELVRRLSENPMLFVQSAFSHLAASEDPKEDNFTRKQIETFRQMGRRITEVTDHPVLMHILNSAGISRFPAEQFGMVRLGISLYGIADLAEDQEKLQSVATLRSTISQIKSIGKGEAVGYNRSFIAKNEIRIAIIPIGYADGLSRTLSNGKGTLVINGSRVPIIGNVCMDMCMADITGVAAEEGDEVIIFGQEKPVPELAREMETIPYEVLTGISRRVKRVYYHE
jgi:alanine racemase